MAKLQLSKIYEHNLEVSKTGIPGIQLAKEDIRETLMEDAESFSQDLMQLRSSFRKDANGKLRPARMETFTEFLAARYGIFQPKDANGRVQDGFGAIRTYLKLMGIHTDTYSIADAAQHLGLGIMNKASVEQLMTTEIATGKTFVIREVILEAIRFGFLNASLSTKWQLGTQPMSDRTATSPQIKKGNATPKYLNEGESIPVGSNSFAQKTISTRKVGVGCELTDELIQRSSIDQLALFIQTVGEDMGLAKDCIALVCLLNGEQVNLSENAPVIGVNNTSDGIKYKDMARVVGRGRRLGHNYGVVISNEAQSLKVATNVPELLYLSGVSTLANLQSIFNKLPNFDTYVHGLMASTKYIFLDPTRCMQELEYQGMKVETRRNPEKQKDELYITTYVGFSIVRRDARVVLDEAVTYDSTPFPSWMDVDAYQNNPFITGF